MEESTSPALPLCQCILAQGAGGSEKDPPKGTHSHLTHRISSSRGRWRNVALDSGICSAVGSRHRARCPSALARAGRVTRWGSSPGGGGGGGSPRPPAPIKMLDTDLQVKRQGDRRPFHRACCSPQKGGFQGRGAGMRAAAGGQSRHHCPRSLGEGVMLTQGFLPAKGVGGRVFPLSLAVSLVKLGSNRNPGIQIPGADTRRLGGALRPSGHGFQGGEVFVASNYFRELCFAGKEKPAVSGL